MANTIELAKQYVPLLDTIYKQASKTSVLDVAPALVKAGNKAGSFLIPKIGVVGLGDYSKADGYKAGDVTFEWDEYSYRYDRGRSFTVDAMDDLESLNMAFGSVAGEFIRTQVVPEVDAIRIATLATEAGQAEDGTLDTAEKVVNALNAAMTGLDEAEAGDNRILFITPTLARLVRNQAPTAATTDAFSRCTVIEVPKTRMISEVTLNAGSTTSAGGWSKAAGATDVNFVMLDPAAVFVDAKTDLPRIFAPSVNQGANAWKFDYRLYHDLFSLANKAEGIYAHTVAAVS